MGVLRFVSIASSLVWLDGMTIKFAGRYRDFPDHYAAAFLWWPLLSINKIAGFNRQISFLIYDVSLDVMILY